MDVHQLFSERRVGSAKSKPGVRSGFQRDYDRLIFSSAFRRLQNKTQVFPLPGTAFVHNRLTHSLEVASVGRSLGKLGGQSFLSAYKLDEDAKEFYKYELSNVIAAACLAHDIGNPAFGHSGEKAISSWFLQNESRQMGDRPLRNQVNEKQWADLTAFEGNANAVRILTHSFKGRFDGGFGLTYTTIASILKYPCESIAVDKQFAHRKKYGFFQSEKHTIEQLIEELELDVESSEPLVMKRHPFVYLVEAADDICYTIVDVEDAHRLKILSTETTKDLFLHLLANIDRESIERTRSHLSKLSDTNEAIAFLRAKVINALTGIASKMFASNLEKILEGKFNSGLIDSFNKETKALEEIRALSRQKIYAHDTVMQIELAGYNVMYELLDLFVPAVLQTNPTHKDSVLTKLIPEQYAFEKNISSYEKILSVLDMISGMTDEYATELYRRLKGIVIPSH